jgi:hypothetical protein
LLLYLGSFFVLAGIVAAIGLRRIVTAALILPFVAGAAAVPYGTQSGCGTASGGLSPFIR